MITQKYRTIFRKRIPKKTEVVGCTNNTIYRIVLLEKFSYNSNHKPCKYLKLHLRVIAIYKKLMR